jgi:two-component system cell cycle response regulator
MGRANRDTQKLPPDAFPPPGVDSADPDTEKALSVAPLSVRNRPCLTLLNGPNAGCVYSLDLPEVVIGRDADNFVRLEDHSVSRRHARIFRQGDKLVLEDLGSTNGTFVGGRKLDRTELSSGDRIQIGPKFSLRFAMTDEAEERLQRQLYESSTRDPLTRAFNRKYLWERLAAEVAHARRHKTPLAVLLLDIDEFKQTNDVHGHLAGDAVLRALADKVHQLIRIEDVLARFGGEEFVVLIRATKPDDAQVLAERIRAQIAATKVHVTDAVIGVTVSVGVATLGELGEEDAGTELLAKADVRLYRAKALGRNRVVSGEE